MEFYEKMHMKDFYEQKLKQLEFTNKKLKIELEKIKFDEIRDPFDSSYLNTT